MVLNGLFVHNLIQAENYGIPVFPLHIIVLLK